MELTSHLLEKLRSWSPPPDCPMIRTVDMHTGGEPLRVVVDGLPQDLTVALSTGTVLERRRRMRDGFDSLRTQLMWEPRGHSDMYGCVLMSPERSDSDFAVLFLHNEGYSTMCGHAIIALGKLAVMTGLVPVAVPETPVVTDTPAGQIRSWTSVAADGSPGRVRFLNVPSFVSVLGGEVQVEGLGRVRFDLAYGGAFYAFVDAAMVGLTGRPDEAARLIDAGQRIKRAVAQRNSTRHPINDDLSFLYGTIFICPAQESGVHSRHVCVFADGELDRSPTGTGVSARLAILRERGELSNGEAVEIESIVGSRFGGKVVGNTTVGPFNAIIPEVSGESHVCGQSSFFLDPNDSLKNGFFLC